jgi:hypothetical protein
MVVIHDESPVVETPLLFPEIAFGRKNILPITITITIIAILSRREKVR